MNKLLPEQLHRGGEIAKGKKHGCQLRLYHPKSVIEIN